MTEESFLGFFFFCLLEFLSDHDPIGINKTHDMTQFEKTVNLDSSDIMDEPSRSPYTLSPNTSQYNRLKYYSVLRTGYKQLNVKSSFLKVPDHIAEPMQQY